MQTLLQCSEGATPVRIELALKLTFIFYLVALRESLMTPDSRDVVSRAEYPSYRKRGWAAIDKLASSEVQAIIDDDWRQQPADYGPEF